MSTIQILDAHGGPIPERSRAMSMLASTPPYDAADSYAPHLVAWTPYLGSPDTDFNAYRDRIVSRVRDLFRVHGGKESACPHRAKLIDN